MPILYRELSVTGATAFAAASDAVLHGNIRTVASLPGSFSRKTVKGRDFWYYQVAELNGRRAQIYLGPDTPELAQLIQSHRDKPPSVEHLKMLSRQAITAGCAYLTPAHGRIIARMADVGFFRAGGVLVGTHAFLGYQNLFGLRWSASDQTQDVDFAHAGRNISIALPASLRLDAAAAIESLQMGFMPIQSMTTYVNEQQPDLQIDFLTSMGREGDSPVKFEPLNVYLQPLRFMEFSMEATTQLTLLTNVGPILVNVPLPQRYAVHKLLVYGERPLRYRAKAVKDLAQAESLIAYLLEHDEAELRIAWRDLLSRGPGWRKRAAEGLDALGKRNPELVAHFKDAMSDDSEPDLPGEPLRER